MTGEERKTRILMIDDEESFRFFVKANLEQTGRYEVLAVAGAREGLRAASSFRPDLILLDIVMPDMDGFEALKRLKRKGTTIGIPVLMLTAMGDEESMRRAAASYEDDYLVKPVAAEVLESKIEKALQRIRKR